MKSDKTVQQHYPAEAGGRESRDNRSTYIRK